MEIGSSASSSRLTFGGLATGLDTKAILDALLEVERQPLLRLQARRDGLEQRQALFRDLNSKLLELRDAALAVDNRSDTQTTVSLEEELLAYDATSSDERVVTATASSDAAPGTYQVRVDALATVGRRVSQTYATPDTVLSGKNKSFSIDYGGAATIDLQIQKNQTTLQDLADAINGDPNNDGSVRADVLFDGSEYRLVISGTEAGAAHDVQVTTDLKNFLDADLTQVASDAQLEAFGVPVTRSGNEVSDVIPGVTIHLEGVNDPADPGDIATIVVAGNNTAAVEKLQRLVDAYNALRDFSLAQSEVNDATGSAGLLSGDPTLRNIERTVQGIVGGVFSFADNPFRSAADLGISFDRNGRLSLDSAKLGEALDQDPRAVRELLGGDDTTDGLATAIGRALEPIVRPGDGTLAIREEGFDDRIRDMDDAIGRFEARLVQREELLVRRFASLETLVTGLQQQAGFLNGLGNGGQ